MNNTSDTNKEELEKKLKTYRNCYLDSIVFLGVYWVSHLFVIIPFYISHLKQANTEVYYLIVPDLFFAVLSIYNYFLCKKSFKTTENKIQYLEDEM